MGIQQLPVSPSSACSTPDYDLTICAFNLPEPEPDTDPLTSTTALTPESNKQQKIFRQENQIYKEHNSDQFPHGSDEDAPGPDQGWQTQGRKLRRVNGRHREDRLLSSPAPADCIIFPPVAPVVENEMKTPSVLVPAAAVTLVSVPPGFTPGKDNDMEPIGVKKQNRYELLYSSEIEAFKETDSETLPNGGPIDKVRDADLIAHSSKFENRESTTKPITTPKPKSKKKHRNRKGKNVNIPDAESLQSSQESSSVVPHGVASIENELGLLIVTDPPKLDPSESLFQSTASAFLKNDDFSSLQTFYVDTIVQLGLFEEFQDSILRIHCIMADLCVQHDQLDAALDILRTQILSKELQLYGTDHLETLTTHLCIASIYDYLHRWEEAAGLHKQISKIFERVYGENDERTIDAEHHYAVALHNERKSSAGSDEAIHIFRKVFIKSKQVLGHDHGKTLKFGYNLAIALHSDGNLDESYKLFHTVAEKYNKKPNRLAIMKIFAIACQSRKGRIWLDRGKPRASIKIFETIVQDLTQILGKDHPVTVSETNKLVRAHLAAGHLETAGRISQSLQPNQRETEDVNGEIIRQRAYFNIDVHKTIRGKVLGTLTPSH